MLEAENAPLPPRYYMIVLVGSQDDGPIVTLTHPAAKKWIEREVYHMNETIPALIRAAYPEHKGEKAHLTCGSYQNDRALQCPGQQYGSTEAALDAIRRVGGELIGIYAGLSY